MHVEIQLFPQKEGFWGAFTTPCSESLFCIPLCVIQTGALFFIDRMKDVCQATPPQRPELEMMSPMFWLSQLTLDG